METRPFASKRQTLAWRHRPSAFNFVLAILLLLAAGLAALLAAPHHPLPILIAVLLSVGTSGLLVGYGPAVITAAIGLPASAFVLRLQRGSFPGELFALFAVAALMLVVLTYVASGDSRSNQRTHFLGAGRRHSVVASGALESLLIQADDLRAAAQQTVDVAREISHADAAAVYQVKADGNALELMASAGAMTLRPAHLFERVVHGVLEWASVESQQSSDSPTSNETLVERIGASVPRSALSVPIRTQSSRLVGALAIYSVTSSDWTTFERRQLEAVAAALGHCWDRFEAEQNLRAQLQFARKVSSVLDEGICVVDATARIVELNPEAERILGVSLSAARGQPLESVARCVDSHDRPMACPFTRPTSFRDDSVPELQIVHPDGRRVPVLYSVSQVNGDASWRGTVITLRDVSALRRIEAERERLVTELTRKQERFDTILRQMPIGVVVYDAASQAPVFSNDRFRRYFEGVPQMQDAVHPQFCHLDSTPYSAEDLPIFRAMNRKEVVTNEEVTICGHGSEHTMFCVNAAPVRDAEGRLHSAVGTIVDLTDRKEMEDALRRSEEQLHFIAKATSDIIYDLDIRHDELRLNEAIESMLGEHFDGRPVPLSWWSERVHEQDRVRVESSLQRAFDRPGVFWTEEYRFRRVDGTYVVLLERGYIVRDASGVACRMVGAMTDITEQQRSEQEQRLLAQAGQILSHGLDEEPALRALAELLVPQITDCCLIRVEQEGQLHLRGEAISDARIRELKATQKPPFAPIPLSSTRAFESGMAVMFPDVDSRSFHVAPMPDELRHEWEDVGVVAVLAVPIRGRDRSLGVMTWVNTTANQRFTDRDLALAEDLARRAASMIENARLYRREQEATRMRERFLSVASHELRAPLAVLHVHIQRSIALLRRDLESHPELDVHLKALEKAESQSERLARMVADLLDVSRSSLGQLRIDPEPLDFVQLAREVVDRLTPQLISFGCKLTATCPESVHCSWDPIRIEQAVVNLIGNAMKYGRGKPIELRIDADEDSVTFSVRDHGIGIAPENLARVFRPFERAVSERSFAGAGLGLYITKQIVEAHRGEISVESEPGQGTTFTVRLPRYLHREEWREAGPELH